MQAAFVDIWNEVMEVGRETDHLAVALERTAEPVDDAQARWETTQMLGSGTEKIYTGCERVMSRIASLVDGAKVDRGEGWHATLLLRMARPFPGTRDAILSPETYSLLDRLRSFRHRQRNTYGFALDAGIVRERAREAVEGFSIFKADIRRFLAVAGSSDIDRT